VNSISTPISIKERVLVTSALPYANGPIHIGHLVEYIQTDIYVRFLRLMGKQAIYCCADDTHGTPIEINAKKQGMTPEQLIAKYAKEHQQDFADFQIRFDSYYSTNSDENKHYADLIFTRLNEKGLIYQKDIELTYCPSCGRFLPDRYVKGTCPKCGAQDQYGDVCEKCNAAYATTDLVEPYCTVCRSAPKRRTSKHYFFRLSAMAEKLRAWLDGNASLQQDVKNFVFRWIDDGLQDWCISRDGPYFGFLIPGETDKYYYVWLDAPIGYIASTANWCRQQGGTAEDWWQSDDTDIVHFIGKDIIYFHFLFWPAMLMEAGFNLPTHLQVHGFLNMGKEKMSKSRGALLTARQYLDMLKPEYLRFYYALNTPAKLADIEYNLQELRERVNAELLDSIVNYLHRAASFCNRFLDSQVDAVQEDETTHQVDALVAQAIEHYVSINLRDALRAILDITDIGNQQFQEARPWKLVKEDPDAARAIVSKAVNIARILTILLKPVLPDLTERYERILGEKDLTFRDIGWHFAGTINQAEPLLEKIPELTKLQAAATTGTSPAAALDLRAAAILEAKDHPDADALVILKIDLGSEQRQLVAGLKKHYPVESLPGRRIVVVANLKPAKLRGVQSNGMLLAADHDGKVMLVDSSESPVGTPLTFSDMTPAPVADLDIKDFAKIPLQVVRGKITCEDKTLAGASVDAPDGANVR